MEEEKETKNTKEIINRIINISLWALLLTWMGICLIDFFNTKAGREPMFCIKNDTNIYADGEVDICTGLGYKVINYKRDSYKGIEYGMIFFTNDRTRDSK